jgi:hypothetical protein
MKNKKVSELDVFELYANLLLISVKQQRKTSEKANPDFALYREIGEQLRTLSLTTPKKTPMFGNDSQEDAYFSEEEETPVTKKQCVKMYLADDASVAHSSPPS